MDRKVAIGSFITIWAISLQVHMMWLKRQDAFKKKFGEAPDVATSNTNTINSTVNENDQQQSLTD